jgi:terminase small subunit / prophage DNA-packing protein
MDREIPCLLGVNKVALNDRGIVVPGGKRGTYAVDASVTAYCEHLRSMAAGRGGEAGASARERLGQAQATLAEVKEKQLTGELVPADNSRRSVTACSPSRTGFID